MDVAIMLMGPVLFWAVYHYYKDRRDPEPFHVLVLMFALGVAAAFVSNLVYLLLSEHGYLADVHVLAGRSDAQLLVFSVVVIGGIEEITKFLPFYLLAIRHAHFNDRLDGIIYASFIALGFATFENIYYLQVLGGFEALGRAVASPLVHVMFASIWGYALGRAILRQQALWPAALGGLGVAIIAHGLFDFFTFGLNAWYRIGPPLLIAVIWLWRMRVFRRAHGTGGTAE